MKNRVAVYAYYDADGKVSSDSFFIISELRKVARTIIFVSNGILADKTAIEQAVDYFVERENKEFDAGAYREILSNQAYGNLIAACDELIFCNNTFYGPFIPLENIFCTMESDSCDFWGICKYKQPLFEYLQSYFLVFRRGPIESKDLHRFFREKMGEIRNWSDACIKFEFGLYTYLCSRGYKSGQYIETSYNLYKYPYEALKVDRFPILKKKALLPENKGLNAAMAVKYIAEKYDYPMDLLPDSDELQIVTPYFKICSPDLTISKAELADFVKKHSRLYIYGAGFYTGYVIEVLGKDIDKVVGILVSEITKEEDKEYMGFLVSEYGRIDLTAGTGIILAMSKENCLDVGNKINDLVSMISIW